MQTRGLSILEEITGTENVSLAELKTYLAIDFDDHNALLSQLLTDAREEVEKYTGLSLIDKNITARWEYLTTQELPYGPVKSITSVQDKEDADVTYTQEGLIGGFVSISDYNSGPIIAKYTTGYSTFPYALKVAIMKLASDHFEFRTGINIANNQGAQELPNDWKSVASRFSRKTWVS